MLSIEFPAEGLVKDLGPEHQSVAFFCIHICLLSPSVLGMLRNLLVHICQLTTATKGLIGTPEFKHDS